MDARQFSNELRSLGSKLSITLDGESPPSLEAWSAVFHHVTPSQFYKRFECATGLDHSAQLTVELDSGGSAYIKANLEGKGLDPEKNWLAFQIFDDAGSRPYKKLAMLNDCYFDAEHQGVNIAKGYMTQMVKLLKELGVEAIQTQANEVGAYAWAKYGFVPETEKDWKALQSKIRQRFQNDCVTFQGTSYALEPAEITAIEKLLKTSFANLPEDFPQFTELNRKIGEVDDKPLTVGKALLINQPWMGLLRLEDNHISYQRFQSYASNAVEQVKAI